MHFKFRFAALTLLVCIVACPALAQAQNTPKETIDTTLALQYFREAQAITARDDGKLWGISLAGPLLFVDPVTRKVVANQSDNQGLLTKKDEVFIGHLPDNIAIANYTANFGGRRWAMIVWPFLTTDKFQREKLMAHESFHRVQQQLLLPVTHANNTHLDTEEGRYWLQLEWRALRQALTSSGTARQHAIEDALTFRDYRSVLFPGTDVAERAVEMNEGLAEYTGFKLAAKDNAELIDHLTKEIETNAARPTFMGSFAYSSGPAYGVLLDSADPNWRNSVSPKQDLGDLLQSYLKILLPTDLKPSAETEAMQYGGEALRTAEAKREVKRQAEIAEDRQRFLASPTLLVPLSDKRSITVISTKMVPIDGFGTVYPTSHIIDGWGTLEVSKGALMIQNEEGRILQVYLSPPQDPKARLLKGDGWTLQLAPGWSIVPGSREGDFLLQKLKP